MTACGDISLERILQWLDDLDDLFGAAGLLAERMRGLVVTLAGLFALFFVAACGVVAAITEPPLGLAVAMLLFVSLLYRSVTRPGFIVRGGATA